MNFPLNRSRFDSILHNNLESFVLCYLVYPREVLVVSDRLFSRRCICFFIFERSETRGKGVWRERYIYTYNLVIESLKFLLMGIFSPADGIHLTSMA